tara:strand:+ start:205 stop:2022 length:1818 start_codon:yes stop_codon:yes gene_type:complete
MKYNLVLITFLLAYLTYSQNVTDEMLAEEYYRNKEFDKASKIFETLYKVEKRKKIYIKYIDCLIQIEAYKKAERIIKSFYKKTHDPTILIDLGQVYYLQGDEKRGDENFNTAIQSAKEKPQYLPIIGQKFFKQKKYQLSLKSYELAQEKKQKASYSLQIANIHSYMGEIEKMYTELIQLLYNYPNYFQTCKNRLRLTISDDGNNENNQKLKKLLIKSIQKRDSYELSKMIVWLYLQEKAFEEALNYEISIDKRMADNSSEIIALGDIIFENKNYKTALKAFNYIKNKNDSKSYYYEYSQIQILNINYDILTKRKTRKNSELETLANEHKKILNTLGIKSETIFTLQNYCNLLAIYLDKEQEAIKLLNSVISKEMLNEYDQAICKMELAKILTQFGDIWEAILIYAQVEKDFKEDIIGQRAKFEKIKINYYKGDFEWAQTQLQVLKLSTSKLISNNAMKLSLLISDNLNLDTTKNALLLYAESELLFEQKKYEGCLKKLEKLELDFPNHSLIDEVLFKKADVFIELKEFEIALSYLNKICTQYYHDILYDDALFYQATIYEDILKNPIKAKEKYELILMNTPNSIFVNTTRERYKKLRPNNILQLK